MNFIIVPRMLVSSSFLISMYMFIVLKALLISSDTVIVHVGKSCLNPFATLLFNVCTVVTVDCCVFNPCCVGVFGMFSVMYERRLFPSVCNY